MEQYQRFLELQLTKAKSRLALYGDHLEQARAAKLKYPDKPVFKQRFATCEHLIELEEFQIDRLTSKLIELQYPIRK